MTCTYCGSRNGSGETRCRRCGRKPGDSLSSDFPITTGNLAPQLNPASRAIKPEGPKAVPAPPGALASAHAAASPNLAHAVQVPLFRERPSSNIIPIETYAPAPPRPAPKPAARPSTPRPRRPSRVNEDQGRLDFVPPDFLPPAPPAPKKLGTTVEAVIYCDAPVAHVLHRAVAAGLDWAMVTLGVGLFLLVFRFLGG